MTIEWLAGNRLRGTTAERPSGSLQSPSVGGWVEVGRTTLGSANTDMLVSSLPDKEYYMILGHGQGYGSAVSNFRHRFNGDTGNNYASRQNQNGGSDGTYTTLNGIQQDKATNGDSGAIIVGYVANKSDKEKLMIMHTGEFGGTGAGTAPVNRKEIVGKWANTSNPISSYTWTQYQGTDQFQSGNEVVVLGWDPSDSHTTNFWEELDSVTLTGTNDNLDSNTFTAKKYLWVQMYLRWNGTASDARINFNDDTGSNYSRRLSQNGGSDITQVNQTYFDAVYSTCGYAMQVNMFIINNSSNEKLIISHSNGVTSSGAGTAPDRRVEQVGKWANTSSQITSIDVFTEVSSSTFNAGSTLKVWGSD